MNNREKEVDFTFKVFKSQSPSFGKAGEVRIIISPPFAPLAQILRTDLEGEKEVTVLVDRRSGERRRKKDPITAERRRVERRKGSAELFQVVIST